jgi:hypothetical protein
VYEDRARGERGERGEWDWKRAEAGEIQDVFREVRVGALGPQNDMGVAGHVGVGAGATSVAALVGVSGPSTVCSSPLM